MTALANRIIWWLPSTLMVGAMLLASGCTNTNNIQQHGAWDQISASTSVAKVSNLKSLETLGLY